MTPTRLVLLAMLVAVFVIAGRTILRLRRAGRRGTPLRRLDDRGTPGGRKLP